MAELDFTPLFGYTPDVEATEGYCSTLAYPRMADVEGFTDTLKDEKDVALWLPLLEVKPTWRRGSQGIGDCVSWGAELCVTMLMAIQHRLGISGWIEEAATEPIYGGGRVEANGGRLGGYSDGSWGSAAAKWLHDWGVILRQDYSQQTGVEEHDLRKYSSKKAKAWGNFGCGGQADAGREDGKLDQVARKTPVKDVTRVLTVDELEVAMKRACPVSVASGVGYGSMRRNADGIVGASGRWAHQMMYGGVRRIKGRRYFRQFQSWGKSCSGPDPGITQESVQWCSWWTTEEDAQRQLNSRDSFAFSSLEGFPPIKIDWAEVSKTWNWAR
jgi:hypothetical protein